MTDVSITITNPTPEEYAAIGAAIAGRVLASISSAPATDHNTYPFIEPTGFAAGQTWEAGTGPDTLELALSSSPSAAQDNTVSIIVNGVGIAYPVAVKARVGESVAGCDILKFHGPWGASPKVEIAGIPPGGNNGLWIMSVTANGVPLAANGVFDSRGGKSVNAPWVFATNEAPVTFGPPITVADAPPVAELLPPLVPPLTADLTGGIFDAAGHRLTYDKAILVPAVPGLKVSKVLLKNAQISAELGANGAGIRDAGTGIGFTLEDSEITGCQNGVLTFDSNITITRCNIHDNGAPKTERTHNIYVGGNPGTTFTIKNTRTANCLDAHEVKSRAGTTIADGNTHITGGNGSGYDISNGGNFSLTNSSITLAPGAADINFITYATENPKYEAGKTVILRNNSFNGNGQQGIIQSGDPTAIADVTGSTYPKGEHAPDLRGWASVIGEITEAP